MQKNQLTQSLWLLLLTLAFLFFLSYVPTFSLGAFKVKKINLLADIKRDPPEKIKPVAAKKETVKKKTETKSRKVLSSDDTCKEGITCLEDFSADKRTLRKFFQALKNSKNQPVKIAFFGDSFIEGDILCASFRDTLQRVYGGSGVGYVPLASEVAQFRTTIQHTFSGWDTYSLVGTKRDDIPLGISGYAFVPTEENELEYKPGKRQANKKFQDIKLFYRSLKNASLTYQLNDSTELTEEFITSDSLQQLVIRGNNASYIKMKFNQPDSLICYGASFENGNGVYVDNFAMRGNSGMGLYSLKPSLLKQFNHYQDYKLILLQYGLNVVGENDSTDYAWYISKMVKVVRQLKETFPDASIVMLSVSDRSRNVDGEFSTIPAIPVMRDAQREIARKSEVAFWDLYTAMGGENSMLKYVETNPPLAAKDYTHLTYWGGRKIAKKLADAILYEQVRYEKKKPRS